MAEEKKKKSPKQKRARSASWKSSIKGEALGEGRSKQKIRSGTWEKRSQTTTKGGKRDFI